MAGHVEQERPHVFCLKYKGERGRFLAVSETQSVQAVYMLHSTIAHMSLYGGQ